ncbi:hypothetical protein L3X38_007389 [Prunus dulcis]|uniref:Retrovirus-related Pol polyprotein from transposon TNT 1-94-like beta-barrel domain-containing protein n=1 Tax=Prunus dulcis TaxID=3755 RepID=A0AAD4ZUM9_PRUDU|nr:hypothetical protein L3X38_007389 [Prunus dulcis]
MTKPVHALFEHGDITFDIWEAARKTYTVTQNSSRLFQLRRQSILTCQNGESVKVFYEKLHAIWQEIDCLRPYEFSCANDEARRLKEVEADQVYDFFGGLDPSYDGVCSRILALSPVSPLLEAYAMVMEEDTCMGSNTWIISTGASDHMTFDNNMFDELFHNLRDPYITSANGLPSPVTGEGIIQLTHSLPLSHAFLVPNIRCNLLSVERLLDTLNASATFYSTHCFFKISKLTRRLGIGNGYAGCITYSYRLQQFVVVSLIKSRMAVSKTSNNFGCGIVV